MAPDQCILRRLRAARKCRVLGLLPLAAYNVLLTAGCATPQYMVRPTPMPDESASAIQIERTISALQAREFDAQGARPVGPYERIFGFDIQRIVDRLSRVTERPTLFYRAYLYRDNDPNAAALADGRIYINTGLLQYLADRGSRPDELAFVLGHELAHTVAQHLVKRYRLMQQQQLVMAIVAAGAQAVTQGASAGVQQAGRIALDAASMLQDVRNSGFSQEQELEADQLGIRYVLRAGFDPKAALGFLQDFERFDSPSPLLRTHPYIALRRAYLERYLQDGGLANPSPAIRASEPAARIAPEAMTERAQRLRALRQTQQLYPRGSVSWHNLQRQIDRLERAP